MKETKKNIQLEAILAEYKGMREAIKQLHERQGRDLYFTFLVFIGAISVGFKWHYSILYMASSFIILYLWLDEIRIFNSIIRLGTYIEIFIEQEIDELKHFTMSGEHRLHKEKWLKLSKAFAHSIIPILSFTFFLLALPYMNNLIPNISCFISIIVYCIYSLIFIICFIYLFKWSIRSTLCRRYSESVEWIKIKRRINK